MLRRSLVGGLLAVVALSLATAPAAQAAAYIKFDGVDGESVDKRHKGEIDVLSWSWGATSTGSGRAGGGAGKVQTSDFTFTKRSDRATPALFHAVASGRHIPCAVVSVTTADGGTAMRYTMEDVIISSLQVSGDAGRDMPLESVSFNFARLELEHQPGARGDDPSARAGWDFLTHEPFATSSC